MLTDVFLVLQNAQRNIFTLLIQFVKYVKMFFAKNELNKFGGNNKDSFERISIKVSKFTIASYFDQNLISGCMF